MTISCHFLVIIVLLMKSICCEKQQVVLITRLLRSQKRFLNAISFPFRKLLLDELKTRFYTLGKSEIDPANLEQSLDLSNLKDGYTRLKN